MKFIRLCQNLIGQSNLFCPDYFFSSFCRRRAEYMIALHKEQNTRSFSSRASSRRKASKNQWTKAAGAGLAQGSPQPVEWTNRPTLPGKNWFNCWTNVSISAPCDIDFPNTSGPIAEKGKRPRREGHLYTSVSPRGEGRNRKHRSFLAIRRAIMHVVRRGGTSRAACFLRTSSWNIRCRVTRTAAEEKRWQKSLVGDRFGGGTPLGVTLRGRRTHLFISLKKLRRATSFPRHFRVDSRFIFRRRGKIRSGIPRKI